MTSDSQTTFSPGFPVEIGRIDKELARLWEESGDGKSRASLINLAVYTERQEDIASNTELIARIASEHACRAILIYANRKASTPDAKAWISAHCHLSGRGEGQICSEQITFQLDGNVAGSIPNVVFSHLDSDLPLCVWWQAPFSEPIEPELWSWVDRLIYDSQKWPDPAAQLGIVRRIGSLADSRTVVCDLNWARLLTSRFALANVFDHPVALRAIPLLDNIEVTHAPGYRTTALLLLGWLAAQLKWSLDSVLDRHTFRTADRREINFTIREDHGAPISRCRFNAGPSCIDLTRSQGGDFFHADITSSECEPVSLRLPAGKDSVRDTLLMELGRSGVHPLYHKALAAIDGLL